MSNFVDWYYAGNSSDRDELTNIFDSIRYLNKHWKTIERIPNIGELVTFILDKKRFSFDVEGIETVYNDTVIGEQSVIVYVYLTKFTITIFRV